MQRQPVTSTSLVSVGYDPESQVLEVEFTHSGVYQYMDVPAWCYDELLRSDSIGAFVNSQVRPNYRYVRQ